MLRTLSYCAGGAHGGGGPPPTLLPGRAGRRHSIQVNKTLKNPPEVVFKDILYTVYRGDLSRNKGLSELI